MKVLETGNLGLLGMLGNDETIAKAAWVSYAKQETEHTEEQVEKLINYLAKHRHGTPFEHVVFQFYVKAPLVVVREWQRHRIGSFNEVSGRYITFEPEFYTPEKFRVKAETNKQGSVVPEEPPTYTGRRDFQWPSVEDWSDWSGNFMDDAYSFAHHAYLRLKSEGVANELARLVLPLGMYTEFWWTVNLRSLFNFVSLRSADNAMWEIQEYSRSLEKILQEKVPIAYQAFINNGRVAP